MCEARRARGSWRVKLSPDFTSKSNSGSQEKASPAAPTYKREEAYQPSYNPKPFGSVTFWTNDGMNDPPDRSNMLH